MLNKQVHSCSVRCQQGFSLLEVLVAFSILAISLSVILNIFSTGVRAAFLAEEYTIAVQIAESLMAKTGKETKLSAADSTGSHGDKFKWQVKVQPFDPGIDSFDAGASAWEVYQVQVKVYWLAGKSEREVALQTLKLAARIESDSVLAN
jgi:general secretion pathway protein I